LAQYARCIVSELILGFIGMDDVQTVRAEGMNIPPLAIHAVPNGEKAVEALVI
jgi:FMN-dependent NADH-azoreductase